MITYPYGYFPFASTDDPVPGGICISVCLFRLTLCQESSGSCS